MKIYTEVNYKWIDGSLVQTSSKSFDYTGDLTLCGGGGGGGGKGGGGGGGGLSISNPVSTITEAVSDVGTGIVEGATNVGTGVVETATGVVETAADVGTGVVETAVGGVESLAETAVDVGEAALEGVHEGVDMGTEALHSVTDTGKDLLHSGADALTDGRDTLTGLFVEDPLQQVMGAVSGVTGGGAAGTESFAKGNKGKKQKNNPFLAIEKGKKSARGSTKIRRPSSTLKINK
jgi:hypothetical protein